MEHIHPEQSHNAVGARLRSSTDLENQPSKPLRHIYVKFMSIIRLFEEGKVIEAWTGLSSLICIAELIGCQAAIIPLAVSVTDDTQYTKTAPLTCQLSFHGVCGGFSKTSTVE